MVVNPNLVNVLMILFILMGNVVVNMVNAQMVNVVVNMIGVVKVTYTVVLVVNLNLVNVLKKKKRNICNN